MIWRKFSDDWFTYYINIKTGEKKFILNPEDIEVNDFGEIIDKNNRIV